MFNETFLKIIEAYGMALAAMGAIAFGYYQKKINERQYNLNKRIKELQDYVAVSIVPLPNFRLQIRNVGKINLYLHKWEIGSMVETFKKPLLMPTEGNVHINTSIPSQIGEKEVKIYLTDESGIKYLSTGGIIIEPISAPQPLSFVQPRVEGEAQERTTGGDSLPSELIMVKANIRAWSYKMEKYDWNI